MRLQAWRETWMWLAVSACGAPAWMTKSGSPKVSIYDAPPLAGARYVAIVSEGDFGHPGPQVGMEHGAYNCRYLVEQLDQNRGRSEEEMELQQQAKLGDKSCDMQVARALLQRSGDVFVVDAAGPRWLSAQQIVQAAAPIDTPAKALLVVWLTNHDVTWGDNGHYYGSAEDGLVRRVSGGFEVVIGSSKSDADCGGSRGRETVTQYRHVMFVDERGVVREREKVATNSYDVADPCHPMGRRPADFVDITSGGTVHGYFVRALHHEAESVRAFERIARELRAFGAPEELWRAAERAAADERDHAARCAELAGVPLAIASDELPVRSAIELAIDNMREGCIGESYAALVAVVQAQTAAPTLRTHFAAIAADELAHAALAHAIAEWLEAKLTAAERDQVRAARAAALTELAAGVDTHGPGALGLPSRARAITLLDVVSGLARATLGCCLPGDTSSPTWA